MRRIEDVKLVLGGRPTHTCFDDAAQFLLAVAEERPLRILQEHRLVHALCRMNEREKFSHAWVEHGKLAFHCQFNADGERFILAIPKYILYRKMEVIRTYKYTPLEAMKLSMANGGSGPWVDELRVLCSDYRAGANLLSSIQTGVS